MYKVTLTQIIEKMELKNLLPDIDTDSIDINQSGVNRHCSWQDFLSILIPSVFRSSARWNTPIWSSLIRNI